MTMSPLTGKKVYVLDKSATLIHAITAELETRRCQVQSANNSVTALMEIIHWHPDLFITGVEVGELKGDDLCLLLKLMPDYAGIPIVVMTSSNDEHTQKKVRDAGADFYVLKENRLLDSIIMVLNKVFLTSDSNAPGDAGKPAIQKVLVVDDSKVMRRVIINILASIGINQIVEADNGAAALRKLNETPVDLIMTDWNMPVMNGLEFVKHVRKEPRFNKVRIAMITTESGKRDVAEAKGAGVSEMLKKPFSKEDLRAMMARLTA